MNSFVTHPKVSVLLLFVILFFLLGSSLQAAVATQSTENGNIKSPVKEIQLSPKEKAWLQDKHIVRIRVGNAPPLMFDDGGEIRGIAIDYVNLIFTRNGIKFKYILGSEVTWPEALEYIKKHEVVDMVPTAKVTQKRKEYMLFTNEYIFSPWVIFTREDSDFISTIKDLNGKTVSVEEGYVMHKKLEREYPEINLLVSPANSKDYTLKPIRDVSFGQADAYIGNLLMITYRLQKEGYTNVKVAAPTPFGNHNQSMGIRNDWPELVSIINKTLDSMTPGEHAAIRNKWLSMRFEYGISPTYVLKWVSGIIGMASLILVMILLWNRKLSREIRVRKKAEEALAESESRFREMFEQSPFGIALIGSLTGHIYALNPKFAEIAGRTIEEMEGGDWMSITHPDDVQEDSDNMALLNAGKINGFNMDKRYIRPDGSHVWINMTIAPVAVEDKAHPRHLCMIDDITDQRLAGEALRESEELHKEAQRVAHIGHWELYPGIGTSVWSDEIFRAFGLNPQEKEPSFTDYETHLHPDDWPLLNKAVTLASTEGTPFDISFRIVRSDGEIRWMHAIGTTTRDENGKVTKLFGTAQDITDRKRVEAERQKFFLLAESSSEFIGMCDLEMQPLYVNPAGIRMVGLPDMAAACRVKVMDYFFPEDQAFIEKEFFPRVLRNGSGDVEIRLRHFQTGEPRWVFYYLFSVRDLDGKEVGWATVSHDITESKQAEEALKKSQRLLSETERIGKVGGWEFNIDTEKLTWTEEVFNIHEVDVTDDLTVSKAVNFYTPASMPIIERALQRAINHGEPFDVELEIITAKGNLRNVHAIGKAHLENHRIYGFFQDITERVLGEEEKKGLEDRLQKAQKMEAMGLMAGGIAHDLNNILSGIVSYPELLLMDLPEDSPLRKPIKTIQESGMRAADVVEDLLTIARGVATGKEALNLNTIITEYLGSAEYQKLEKTHSFVSCRTELDPDLLNMSGSPTHIKKILMNLVTNATEAIEGSGTVTISTTSQYLDEPLKGYEDVHIGEYVVLTISDDGSGISPGDLERIFEPFYTKKMMGRSGTGLGLAVVWNTVQDHNGYINVKSSEKRTEFELYFPLTREKVVAEEEEVPVAEYQGHGEKILVVDDEERQREIASGILNRLGYTAEAVSSGEKAIEYVKENPVDLIVLDMVMPKGINGRKTYEEIIKIHPGQKAIIASGYAKTKEVDKAQELGAGKYIKKPYTLPKVGLAVKEELEK